MEKIEFLKVLLSVTSPILTLCFNRAYELNKLKNKYNLYIKLEMFSNIDYEYYYKKRSIIYIIII